ncbi:MAG: DUF1934 domain-containing protein [Streptococcaceae bacterium]|nr:DUF1934 domain-containing protein [Streptococcaceae bacterium]
MKIIFDNQISIDNQHEHLTEEFDGDAKLIDGKTWLTFENTDKEKVLVKFDETELVMTRYGDFPTTMRYVPDKTTQNQYQGLGTLDILTKWYEVFTEECRVLLHYTMFQGTQELGNYKLEITYKDD